MDDDDADNEEDLWVPMLEFELEWDSESKLELDELFAFVKLSRTDTAEFSSKFSNRNQKEAACEYASAELYNLSKLEKWQKCFFILPFWEVVLVSQIEHNKRVLFYMEL